MAKAKRILAPIHPGEHLREFMDEHGLSATRLGRDIDIDASRITTILTGKRAVTADTALRLGRYFGTTPEFWMNLQADYDLRVARQEIGEALELRVRAAPRRAAA